MDRVIRERAENKLRLLARQFEMVVKTTRDPDQKKRASSQYSAVMKKISALENGTMSEEDARKFLQEQGISNERSAALEQKDDEDEGEQFSLLATIPITVINEEYVSAELNAIYSYLQHFEFEYMPALGSQQLKLDFSHTQKRDSLFHSFTSIQLAMKGFIADITDPSYDRLVQGDQTGRLRQVRRKMQMDIMMKCSEFTANMRGFLETLLNDHRTGGNLILNPDDRITFDPIHGQRELGNMLVSESVERVCLFLDEFAEYLNVPGF